MDGGVQSSPATDGEEVPFGLEELFYSRTDHRGVILAGNQVFQRVSHYAWPELIGAPHKIVRNPVTPKAAFRILWQLIETGEPAVAYVCNRAANGQPYWVLATILPFDGGYLSVRLKPSSPVFATVRSLYAKVAAAEAAGQSIEEGVDQILAALRELGHADYPAFMRAALRAEYAERAVQMPQSSPLPETTIAEISKGLMDSMASQRRLQTDFEGVKILPTNLSILAARLEPEGGPLGAVAGLYMSGTLDTMAQINAFTAGKQSLCNRMSDQFERAIFLVTCAELQREMSYLVAAEDWTGSGLDPEAEAGHLQALQDRYDAEALAAIDAAVDLAKAIERAGAELRRSMLSLETVTVMGKVEGARLGPEGDRIRTTVDSLHELNGEISSVLARITDLSATIDRGMSEIREGFRGRSRRKPPRQG
ncbi:histidine kinase [Stagnihabitans tardus]|uniref:Histidine kinase n=1 Tax=Stagnihabitans tardus TaxID=2699202 RepID=A0AAE5BSA9_9RHOB|nr:histidine kinase [Stagnihabitans tardus]NBZ87605.1 histidine kinase [Stagnihabitans tardus]